MRAGRRGWLGALGWLPWLLLPWSAAPAALALPERPGSGALYVRGAQGDPWGSAPLLETDVELAITGPVARARVLQRFRNPSDRWLEGLYLFPLPESAAVDHLELRVGGRVIEGRIRERAEAKRHYERARQKGRRASLVEQERPNLFTTRVANLGPGEAVEVAIEYQQALVFEAGGYRLRFPMVAAPRFEPEPLGGGGGGITLVSTGAAGTAGPEPLGQCLDPPRLGPDELAAPIRVHVDLAAGFPLAELYSPSHAVAVERDAWGHHRIFLDDFPDRDFVLVWKPEAGSQPRAALLSESSGEVSHALLMVMPPDATGAAPRLAREVVFVIDTSGSMGGASIEQARAALRVALDRLAADDSFNLIEFDDQIRVLFPSSVPASPSNLAVARRRVRRLQADGGTHMLPALYEALVRDGGHGDVRQVVFITDGSIGNEAQLFRAIERELGRSRLFTVGIGSAPNGHFLTRAAEHGRGTHTFIANPGEVDAKMGELLHKLESPVLSDIDVHWNDEVEMWPRRVPDLYAGEPLVVTAELARFAGDVIVSGRRGEQPWEVRLPLTPGRVQRGIGVLWARNKIAARMGALASGADPEQVRRDVLEVALRHHLVSRYTSLVAVDVTPVRPAFEGWLSEEVPLALPAGWDPRTVAGVLPQGATPGPFQRGLGVALLAVAALLAGSGRRR